MAVLVMTSSTDTRDMFIIHALFRRELGLAPALVRGVGRDRSRAAVVADHLELIEQSLHRHHQGEDELLWPLLQARVGTELQPLVTLMQDQHEQVHHLSSTILDLRTAWRADPTPEGSATLAEHYEALQRVVNEHLSLEEREILPLAATHVSPKEWARLGEEGRAHIPKDQRNVLLGMLLHDGGDSATELLFEGAPRLVRFIMPKIARNSYQRYAKRVYGQVPPVVPLRLT